MQKQWSYEGKTKRDLIIESVCILRLNHAYLLQYVQFLRLVWPNEQIFVYI